MQDVWQIICEKLALLTVCDHGIRVGKFGRMLMVKLWHDDHPQECQTFAIVRLAKFNPTDNGSIPDEFDSENTPVVFAAGRINTSIECPHHCTTSIPFIDYGFYGSLASAAQSITPHIALQHAIVSVANNDVTFRSNYNPSPRASELIHRVFAQIAHLATVHTEHNDVIAETDSIYDVGRAILAMKLFSDVYQQSGYRVYNHMQTPAVTQFCIEYQRAEESITYEVAYFLTRRGCKVMLSTTEHTLEMSGSSASECVVKVTDALESQAMRDIIRREFASIM